MTFECVAYEKSGGVAVVTLDRPDVSNAIDERMRDELSRVWSDFKRDDDCRVAVVTGSGEHFCAGLDHRAWPGRGASTAGC